MDLDTADVYLGHRWAQAKGYALAALHAALGLLAIVCLSIVAVSTTSVTDSKDQSLGLDLAATYVLMWVLGYGIWSVWQALDKANTARKNAVALKNNALASPPVEQTHPA